MVTIYESDAFNITNNYHTGIAGTQREGSKLYVWYPVLVNGKWTSTKSEYDVISGNRPTGVAPPKELWNPLGYSEPVTVVAKPTDTTVPNLGPTIVKPTFADLTKGMTGLLDIEDTSRYGVFKLPGKEDYIPVIYSKDNRYALDIRNLSHNKTYDELWGSYQLYTQSNYNDPNSWVNSLFDGGAGALSSTKLTSLTGFMGGSLDPVGGRSRFFTMPGGGSLRAEQEYGLEPWQYLEQTSSTPTATISQSKSEANLVRAISAGAIASPTPQVVESSKRDQDIARLSVFNQLTGVAPPKVSETGSPSYFNVKVEKTPYQTSYETEYTQPVKVVSPSTSKMSVFEQITGMNVKDVAKPGEVVYWNTDISKVGNETKINTVYAINKPSDISKEEKALKTAGFDYSGLSTMASVRSKNIAQTGMDIQEYAKKGISTMFGGAENSSNKYVAGTSKFLENLVLGPGSAIVVTATSIPLAAEITGKKIKENPYSFPKFAGTAILGGALVTKEQAIEDPIAFSAQMIGGALAIGSIKAGFTKTYGIIRTSGKEYIPIEKIGYDVKEGFPVSYKITEKSLSRSFADNTLDPFPEMMSVTKKPPSYVPKQARLPTDVIDSNTRILWTGWEKMPSSIGKFVLGEGSSELKGAYTGPVAQTYYTKVGGQMPNILGFDFSLVKRPAIVKWQIPASELEIVPKSVRSGGYPSIQAYIDAKPGGKAFMPHMKAEYEAVIPRRNVVEITDVKYYTKLGGFGKEHFMGTRTPIFETILTGVKEIDTDITVSKSKTPVISPSYYKGSSMLNLADISYSIPSSISMSRVSKSPVISVSSMQRSFGISVSKKNVYNVSEPVSRSYKTDIYKSPISSKSDIYQSIISSKPYKKSSDMSYTDEMYSRLYGEYDGYSKSQSKSSKSTSRSGISGYSSGISGISSYISRITGGSSRSTSYSSHTSITKTTTTLTPPTHISKQKTFTVGKTKKTEDIFKKMSRNVGQFKFRETAPVSTAFEAAFGLKKTTRRKKK